MMTPEQFYISSTPLEHRKKFAQFFTPEDIAEFMCQWVLRGQRKTRVLEPAYGLGIFSRILSKFEDLPVDAFEIDPLICSEAETIRPAEVNLVNRDYFKSDWNRKYDAIVCNPPYLKFHDYDNATYIADVNDRLGLRLNGFTNLYTLFLLKSISQLEEGGRLAYIIPSEFLNSDYGVEVKRTLVKSNTSLHLIVVDFTECAFDDALTTACILLCERGKSEDNVKFSLIKRRDQLDTCLKDYVEYKTNDLDPEIKWKFYYESRNSENYCHLVPFSTFAKVSRGIATGSNRFFTFNLSKIDKYNLPDSSFRRCICHAADIQQHIFTEQDFDSISKCDKTVFLFDGCANHSDPYVSKYISLGEESGVNKRYLTASRSPWFALENRAPSPIWVSVFNRKGLKFVRNKAGVYNLTTFHCVYNIGTVDTDVLFAYLLTDMAKEIFMDNARQYGNGLVKLEPNDLNKGQVVDLRILSTEERAFVKKATDNLQFQGNTCNKTIAMLDDYFRQRFSTNQIELSVFLNKLDSIKIEPAEEKAKSKVNRIKHLSLF